MAEIFSGKWTVKVLEMTGNSRQRIIIEDSDTGSGVYPADTTTPPISVSGTRWKIRFEAFSPLAPKGWGPSHDVRRIGAAYTLQDGLDVSIRASSRFGLSSHINHKEFFNNCVLLCRNVEPQINPWHPFVNPYNFTLPKPKRPRQPR